MFVGVQVDPLTLLQEAERHREREIKLRAIGEILDELEKKGLPPRQAAILEQWRTDRPVADAIRDGRATRSAYDALVRKVKRRLPGQLGPGDKIAS